MTKRHRSAVTGGGIYAIVRMETGQMYVGSAVSFRRRWSAHRSTLFNGNHHCLRLLRSFRKYGEDAFDYVVLERVADSAMLLEREQYWIDALQPEYNMAPVAGSNLGAKLRPRTPEHLARMSESRMGKKRGPHSEEHRAAISAAHKGKTLTPEHRAKLSQANTGKRASESARAAMSRAGRGRKRAPPTAEARANMAAAQRGKKRAPFTDEARANMAEAQRGKRHSEAARRAMSEAQKRRRARERAYEQSTA